MSGKQFAAIRVHYAPASLTSLFPYLWFAAKRRSLWLKKRAIEVNCPYLVIAALLLTNCATTSTHQFAQPVADWQTRSGQLLYRTPNRTVIGDAVVRFSKTGDFELTFSKGPVTLLTIRQDGQFAEVKGAFAGRGWAGSVDHAPQQLRGWLGLRDAIIRSPAQHQIRHVSGSETFIFRF